VTNLRNFVLPLAVVAVAIVAPGAIAQVSSGDLVGAVLDASGGAVPNAAVEAQNVATAVKTRATANQTGQYRIGNLTPGTYNITATAPGFSAASLRGVVVDANKVATANLAMQVGQVSTTVEVESAPAVIDTTTATVQNTFDTAMARDLPMTSIGIGVANLSLLNAGVSSNGNIGAGEGPSIGGQRPYNNNFMIEGVDNNNKSVTGSLLRSMPNDAVAEFTVLQNQMSAEYGHSSGGQFNTILKGGTNQIHGSLYEYFQNRNLNAIDQQVQNQAIANGVRPSNPRFDSNRFGGSIGGPIIKNKLFYFGLFEYNPVGQATVPAAISTPTAAGLSQLAAIPGISQANLDIFKQFVPVAPVANDTISVAGRMIAIGTPQFASPNYQNNSAAVGSIDYNISDHDQVRGRFVYNKLSQIDTAAALPQFYILTPGTYYLASINEYHNFTPTLNNELRLGYNRLNQTFPVPGFKYPGLDAFPSIIIDELSLEIGPDTSAPQGTVQNTYQLADNLTWVKGAHTLKFGFDGRKYIAPATFTQRSRGEYEYGALETFLADLTPDIEAQRGLGNVTYYGDQIALYGFVNDMWRMRPNFTVDLGLRYEYLSVPYSERLQTLNAISNVPGLLTFDEPQPQTKNFAPRIGLAYSPGTKGTTSIRAGFGMAYDVLYDNIGILQLPPQLKTTADVTNSGPASSGAPDFLKNGGITPNFQVGSLTPSEARALTAAYIGPQVVPYSLQWNFGIQQVFAHDYTFEARYLGTRGVHLDVQRRLNKQARVTATENLPTYLNAPSQGTLDSLPLTLSDLLAKSTIVPRFAAAGFTNAGFVEDAPIGNSSYHGLALQLNRRFSNGLQFQTAYTWSHLIDDSTADFNTTALTPRRPQDFQNMRPERATSALDRRQRFTFAGVYEVPWFKQSNWALKNLAGNWTVAPVYTFESPEYVTVQSNVDSNLNGDSAPDRVIINPSGQDSTGSAVVPLCRGTGPCSLSAANIAQRIVGYLAVNPNARYIVAGQGAYANGGRNTLSGRRINDWDLNLLKNFSITERFRAQFSAQLYNLFNHPQFIPGFVNRIDAVSSAYNNTAAVKNYTTPGTSVFNNPEAIYSSNPRNIQLAVKVIF
jgi:hypothetical protein